MAEGASLQTMSAWIRTATSSQINERDAATYAQYFVNSGADRVELLAGVAEEFDEKIGDRIQSIMHRRLLKSALRTLTEAKTSEDGGADDVEDASKEMQIDGPGGRICTVRVRAAWTLEGLKDAVAAESGIPTECQRLFHGVKELETVGDLFEGDGCEELLLVRAAGQLSFEARWKREDSEEQLGLKVDFSDNKTCHVCRVSDVGTVARYNASVGDGKMVMVGDYLMAINGVSGTACRDQLLTSMFMEVKVSRPCIFECTVEKKEGHPWGLELAYSHNGASLVIVEIGDGTVKASAPEIEPGDRIVGIGAFDGEGDPERLLQLLRYSGDAVLLKLSRPAVS